MMKLKLQVQPRQTSETRVLLKPVDCGLDGILAYDLPVRAASAMQPGSIVEASVGLPDQYPVDGEHHHPACEVAAGWMPIASAPMREPVILGALDYFGRGRHAVAVGFGKSPERPGACVYWLALLRDFDQLQVFTPTHWQPLPLLKVRDY